MNRQEILSQLPTAWRANERVVDAITELLVPKTIVDLGVDWGFSSFVFADRFPNAQVYGVDWFQGDQHAGFRNTYETVHAIREDLKFNNLVLVSGDFAEVARYWNKPIDVLHIDGEHTYEAVTKNYLDWRVFVPPTGLILFHDTVSFPDTVGRFFEELDVPKFNFVEENGLGIVSQDAHLISEIKEILTADL